MAHLSTLKHTTDSLDSIKADAISIGIFKDGSMTSGESSRYYAEWTDQFSL